MASRALLYTVIIITITSIFIGALDLTKPGLVMGNTGGTPKGNVTRSNATSTGVGNNNTTASIMGARTGNLAMVVIPANKTKVFGEAGVAGEGGFYQASAFNDKNMRTSDFEDININFPYFDDNTIPGPSATLPGSDDRPSRINVLPFGPIGLAFPSIRQNVAMTMECESTSFTQCALAETMSYPALSLMKTPLPSVIFEL